MTYEEFKEALIKCSHSEECMLSILSKSDSGRRFSLVADEIAMMSSIWFNPSNKLGEITWKECEGLLEEGKWENYPLDKRTIMYVDGKEYIIEMYELKNLEEI